MTSKVKLDQLTKVYVKIRDKRSELSAKFKEEDERLKSQQDTIKKALLNYCKEENVDSVRTEHGVFYRSVRTRYWTNDWESMHQFIVEHNVPQLLDKRINQTNIKDFLAENPELSPPGLNIDSEFSIAVRKK